MKKALIFLALLCALAAPAFAQGVGGKAGVGGSASIGGGASSFTPLAFVQDNGTITGANPYTAAFTTANNTIGSSSCAGIGFAAAKGTGTNSVTGITSSLGNTYSAVPGTLETVAATNYDNIYVQWWCARITVGGGKDSLSIALAQPGIFSVELIEIGPGGVLDQVSIATGTGTSISAGSVTTPSSGAFGITVVVVDDGFGFGNGWFTGSLGWTIGAFNMGGGSAEAGAEYQAQSSAGVITGSLTQIHGNANHWVASMITIRTH